MSKPEHQSAVDEAEMREVDATNGADLQEDTHERTRAGAADAASAQAQRELHLRKGEELIHSLL